ncbi:hypothetical protein L484_027913 [Morus notabilis]|uniref:Uncharacterized protein n=1 Tax=Morus notabilis TaxID=981085 RepID=W9SFI2_9ROSA|nr:hypothetical protein L484_027913 [Morus notabilis]
MDKNVKKKPHNDFQNHEKGYIKVDVFLHHVQYGNLRWEEGGKRDSIKPPMDPSSYSDAPRGGWLVMVLAMGVMVLAMLIREYNSNGTQVQICSSPASPESR